MRGSETILCLIFLVPGELQGDPKPCVAEGLHVLHLQNQVVKTVIHSGFGQRFSLFLTAHKHASHGHNNHNIDLRYTNSSTEIPEFPIPPEIALELLMAANFLDC